LLHDLPARVASVQAQLAAEAGPGPETPVPVVEERGPGEEGGLVGPDAQPGREAVRPVPGLELPGQPEEVDGRDGLVALAALLGADGERLVVVGGQEEAVVLVAHA